MLSSVAAVADGLKNSARSGALVTRTMRPRRRRRQDLGRRCPASRAPTRGCRVGDDAPSKTGYLRDARTSAIASATTLSGTPAAATTR